MPLHASKLDLLSKAIPPISSSSLSVTSLLFEPSSNSLALSLSDSSYLLFPAFSSSPPSQPPTTVHPTSTAASFIRILPINRVLFLAAGPLNAGASLAFRAWILHPSTLRFSPFRLTYKNSAPATIPLAHGFGVRLIGTVNYFVVHAPAAGQMWVMAARVEKGEEKDMVSVDLVKCAVVECELPIYSIGMSMAVIVLGEIGGVRVFPLRVLVKRNGLKGKRKGQLGAGNSGDDGVLISYSNGGTHKSTDKNFGEDKTSGKTPDNIRRARVRQSSGDLYSFFMEIKCKNATSESNTGTLSSVKAVSIHVLPQKQFLILDSLGDLHLLTLHGTYSASEDSSDSSRSSKYAIMYCLDVKMKIQVVSVPPDVFAKTDFIWISDGAYSLYMMSVAINEHSKKGGEEDEKKEKSTVLSVDQVIFTSEKVQHIIALSAKAILLLCQGNIFEYSIA